MSPEILDKLINEHFGTKALFSARMRVSRHTCYRWVKDPSRMTLKDLERLSVITKKPICEFYEC
jgi:hypothetical protein